MSIHRSILRTVCLGMIIFFLARVALWMGYRQDVFADMSGGETVYGFWDGFRFDASVLFTFIGLPLVASSLPLPRKLLAFSQPLGIWWARITIVVMAFVLSGDVIYFGYIDRHMFDELIQLSADLQFLSATAFKSFPGSTVLAFTLVGVALWLWQRQDRWPQPTGSWALAKSAGWLVLFALCVRGSFGKKPLNIPDAFRFGNEAHAQLALNGIFSAWHASRHSEQVDIPPVDPEQAKIALASVGIGTTEPPTLKRAITPMAAHERPYRNVVIFLLESWFNTYLDSLNGQTTGMTPNFDRMAKQGILFSNFFASGSRSIEAIQSLLTSVPPLPGQPHLGLGLEMVLRTGLGSAARERNMVTFFAQSAPRDSFRLKAVSGALNFEHYFGLEDFEPILAYDQTIEPIFGYDYEMMQHMKTQFDGAKKPFVAFLFTGSTHTPFMIPPLHLSGKTPQLDPEGEQGFLQTLYYSDASLGAFMKEAESSPWFEDTLFVMTGDHTFPKYRDHSTAERYRVPLLLWSPRMKAGNRPKTFGTHVDVLPTIAPLLGWQGSIQTAGRDLLNLPFEHSFAFIPSRTGRLVWIDPQGLVRMQGKKVLEESGHKADCDAQCFDALARKSASMLQRTISNLSEAK